MDNLRKAAEMALETLDNISESGIYFKESPFDAYMRLRNMAKGAILPLQKALAQPEQNKYEVIAGQFVFIDGAAKNPFQREWVSLTDADIASLENIHETHGLDVRNIAQIINSLLRDRNK